MSKTLAVMAKKWQKHCSLQVNLRIRLVSQNSHNLLTYRKAVNKATVFARQCHLL